MVVWRCFCHCGGVFVIVVMFLCWRGSAFMFLWWCGGVFVFLWWCFGGVFVVVF